MHGVDRDRRGRGRLLAVLLLVSLATGWVAMYVMHLAPSGDKAATVQIAAMPAGARAAVEKGETLTIGAPLMPCRSFAVPCLRPSVPWHHLQAALLSVFLTAVVLLPIKSARLGRRARFALPPPTLAVLSISRT